uniref:Uncharacterized protein n=1 Tax=viral metagenome TaxID=1070528 RepID=A0A6C0JGC5_9ZZZZ
MFPNVAIFVNTRITTQISNIFDSTTITKKITRYPRFPSTVLATQKNEPTILT